MKEIGIGIIVGLAMTSFLYVLNSNSFTKGQKALILTLIIFPPAHWIVLIIVLIYNNNFTKEAVEANKIVKEIERIKESKKTIDQLKENGLLNEEEYKNKVEKLNLEKNNRKLKNTQEYKQLKNLFDNGVLTNEEFENKSKIIFDYLFNNEEKIIQINSSDFYGSYKLYNGYILFNKDNSFEYINKNKILNAKWSILDDKTILIENENFKTKFEEIRCTNRKIFYVNGKTKFEGKKNFNIKLI